MGEATVRGDLWLHGAPNEVQGWGLGVAVGWGDLRPSHHKYKSAKQFL